MKINTSATINPMNSSVCYGCHGGVYLVNIDDESYTELVVAFPPMANYDKKAVAKYLKNIGRENGWY